MSVDIIRIAIFEDAQLLAELGVRTFRQTFEPLYEPEDFSTFLAENYAEKIQQAELAEASRPALVLEVDGVPMGFAQLRLNHREDCIPGVQPAEVQRIYLLREAQGAGRGAALMDSCLNLVRDKGADVLWLGVWEQNAKALAFYARCGFWVVGEHGFRIGQRLDRDLILVKELL